MPILTRSSRSAAAILLALLASGALAQDTARQKVEAEAAQAAQRIEKAQAQARTQQGASPTRVEAPSIPATAREKAARAMQAQRTSPEMQARARSSAALGEAPLAGQREAMAKRLRVELGLEPDQAAAIPEKNATPNSTWVGVLFVSSSIPVPVLRAYAAQLERVHGVMAFRGMPGGLKHVAPMAKLSAEILRLDPGCEGPSCAMRNVQIIVDPIVFRQHGVTRVPALAMLPGDPAQAYCERDETSARARFLVFGDAALSGLLEEHRRLGGATEVKSAQALLGAR